MRQLAGQTRPEEKRPTPQPQWSAKLPGYCRSPAMPAAVIPALLSQTCSSPVLKLMLGDGGQVACLKQCLTVSYLTPTAQPTL